MEVISSVITVALFLGELGQTGLTRRLVIILIATAFAQFGSLLMSEAASELAI